MTIYVTGAAGFIGSHFVAHVAHVAPTVPVVALDPRLPHQTFGTITDTLAAAGPADTVVLLGALPDVATYAADPAGDVRANVLPIVRQIATAHAAHLVLASSFGGLFSGAREPVSVTAPPRPVSAYFAGKLAAEAYLQACAATHGTSYQIARFANVYGGPGPDQRSPWRGVVPDWIQRRAAARPFDVWGDPAATRDYIHIRDIVSALWRLCARETDAVRPGAVIHLGTGQLTSLTALGTAIAATEPEAVRDARGGADSWPATFATDTPRPGYPIAGSPVDVAETRQQLGRAEGAELWEPLALDEGLRRTWRAFLDVRP
jgi:nucleoside-diphosphate-sugar epimerase